MPGFIRLLVIALCLLGRAALAEEMAIRPVTEMEASKRPQFKTAEWKLETGIDGYHQGKKDQGDAAYAHLDGNFQLNLAPWLRLVGRPRVDFYSARVQERFDSDEYQNRVRLLDGYIAVNPFAPVELRAGFINQGYWDQYLLVSNRRAFPGAQEIVGWTGVDLHGEVTAEQVVPTSYSVDDEREDKERLPTLQIQAVKFSGTAFSVFEWKAMAGHYAWTNPPNKVAFESAQWGNSVEGEVAPGATFKFGFDGWMAGGELCYCASQGPVKWIGEFQRLHNSRAGSGYGDAQLLGIGPRISFGQKTLDLRYRRMFLEKDATISVYTKSGLGGTNRESDSIEASLHFKDYKFAMFGRWLGSTVIRDNDIQAPHNTYVLGVETDYAPF